ncbi:MAG: hypothetical protein Q7S93_05695 [Phenylobacterium sp.]|uniref:hypothetical protein n=1 Tax=Phenylobacterium sp. TaxID=1871053 RepID=UPI002726B9B6|nr:hypothetical protein [Phenylobacterium sp.]MDO8409535.1 hypothetical protein [Phenylobacterium sp.]
MLSEMQIVEREFARRPPLVDDDRLAQAASTPSHTPTPSRPVRWLHAMAWVLEAPSAAVLLGRS